MTRRKKEKNWCPLSCEEKDTETQLGTPPLLAVGNPCTITDAEKSFHFKPCYSLGTSCLFLQPDTFEAIEKWLRPLLKTASASGIKHCVLSLWSHGIQLKIQSSLVSRGVFPLTSTGVEKGLYAATLWMLSIKYFFFTGLLVYRSDLYRTEESTFTAYPLFEPMGTLANYGPLFLTEALNFTVKTLSLLLGCYPEHCHKHRF